MYTVTSKNLGLCATSVWHLGNAPRGRDKVQVLTQHFNSTGSDSIKTIVFHWFSTIFIDITVYMHICETTHYRSRWSGGMTSSDAAECFAEAPGHPGARPDRIWRPAQGRTGSKLWFLWFCATSYMYYYTVTPKNLGLCATCVWLSGYAPRGATTITCNTF